MSPARALADRSPRIVSLAPSITELVYYLEREDWLVGVSTYCDYPPAARSLQKVGGLLDTNFELLLRVEPSLVLAVAQNESAELEPLSERLARFSIPKLYTPQRTLEELYTSIQHIGDALDRSERAGELVSALQRELHSLRAVRGRRYRSLVLFFESISEASAYAAGPSSFEADILEALGLTNVVSSGSAYQQISLEGLLALDPEVIFVIAPDVPQHAAEEKVRQFIAPVAHLARITKMKRFVLTNAAHVRPGPRTLDSIREFRVLLESLQEKE